MTATTLPSGSSNRVWVQQAAIDSVRNSSGSRSSFLRRSSNSVINSNSNNNNPNSSSSSSCCGEDSSSSSSLSQQQLSHGRQHLTWGWKRGTLVESSSDVVVVQLDEEQTAPGMLKDNNNNNEEETSSSSSSLIRLSANALQDGQVVLSNDYQVSSSNTTTTDDQDNNNNNSNNILEPPNDLITLIHLHEPAVVESLQHRYANDLIYTNTGPVLLALNPFQTMRGLYGEGVMKKYWEKAERNQNISTELPPHVYAIADSSFRSMMRALEDTVGSTTTTASDDASSSPLLSRNVSASSAASASASSANQSILVSGESGAGKTVTTKFVMKYLAALSQRSVVLHEPTPRAYVLAAKAKAANNKTADHNNNNNNNNKKTKTYQAPSWANNSNNNNNGSSTTTVPLRSNKKTFSKSLSTASTDALASVSLLTTTTSSSSLGSSSNNKNSIEAQVLQSNPILESFGNARTVRNDNSSRFGKFIEIQFDLKGKLVGAQIETYLLEKVRLCSRSSGERNYHVFYELLSGAMDKNELSGYYLAPTARPQDFVLTSSASNTYDRRDGVSDQDTCRQLRNAMNTMKFSLAEIKDVFKVTSAILHASNLTFVSTSEDTCQLSNDQDNVHLQPVCRLLGVALEDLNKALCSFTIQAGDHVVERTLNQAKAEKGLEALLKSTYGALFTYLVNRINDSIAFKRRRNNNNVDGSEEDDEEHNNNDHDDGEEEEKKVDDGSNIKQPNVAAAAAATTSRPAATIGVLDIFGFESFNVNSFEQLCINYCNEALQQQFNAFVLKNEQAEYEREGIEWSFIEFPENQDVLDLIEKRGAGILSILDDQCRAPGPSDKAFCLDVYNKCTGQARFQASRKQTATLQFSVKHYAGPVEYTAEGFTEKNRDELPKESTELLRNSSIPFIRHLAEIIDRSHELPPVLYSNNNNGGGAIDATRSSPTKQLLRRADSSVGRATVGGQFRTQLRNLRRKVDLTTPHYVRCLKPNDLLVPDHFDTAIVAEQLRCGGILEAVRVARAGFTQHYPHVDFVRRYRALAWRELSKKDYSFKAAAASPRSSPAASWSNGSKSRSSSNFRNSYVPTMHHHQQQPTNNKAEGQKQEMSAADAKVVCKDLLKVLYRKILQLEKDNGSESSTDVSSSPAASPSPAAKAKSYSYKSPTPAWSKPGGEKTSTPATSSYPPPTTAGSGSVKSRHAAWEKKREPATPPPPSTGTWKRGGLTSSDYAKVGIQMGKTKVFLRHKAFEALERIRSAEQTMAATKLNSIFRRYLARLAYIPFRDAFRRELHERCRMFEEGEEYKESKEPDFGDENDESTLRFRSALAFHKGGSFASFSLVDKWMESRIRDAIHNPVPRHEWGKDLPSEERFKWILSDGLWVKNYNHSDDGTTTTTSHDSD